MENGNQPDVPVIDIHTHLAGLGHGETGCFIDPRKFESLLYRLLRRKLGIHRAHEEGRLDQAYLERLDRDVGEAVEHRALAAAVIFPHDRVHTDDGKELEGGQEILVPNEYVFRCAEREETRGRYLPAMSVHPYRSDALESTEKWADRGAVAMKWLPNSQGMDPRDERSLRVCDVLVKRRLPLIVHTGGEHTVRVRWPELGDPETLRPALERGVTVVMAHCGTGSGLFDTNWMQSFCELARRYPNCWGDNSAFNTPGRARWIARILKEEGIVGKLVHGSDYPVPPTAWWSFFALGWGRARALSSIWSFLERDVRIKQARGFPEQVFTNTARVLGDTALRRWGVASPKTGVP
jgi:predicted TIM-barrel fold metal-dependent hydrolase